MRSLFGSVLAVLVLLLAALPAAVAEARCDPLDPSVCMYPFPNDHFTKADPTTETGLRIAFETQDMPKSRLGKPIDAEPWRHSDGFSPGQAIVTRVPGLDTLAAFRASNLPPVDEPQRSLAKDSPVVVLNADTGQRHLVWSEIDSTPEDPSQRALHVRPAVNFDEGARYIVALRNLRDAAGKPIPAGAAFAAYRDRKARDARSGHMERIFASLRKAGVNRKDLFLAWDFTVASAESTTKRMLSIRDRSFAELGDTNLADRKAQGSAPRFSIYPDLPDDAPQAPFDVPVVGTPGAQDIDGIRDFTPEEDSRIARTVRGKLVVPCFLDGPGCPTGSQFRFAPGSDGLEPLRVPANTTAYDFACNIPRRALGADAPPVRIGLYGHGLFGSHGELNQGQLKDLSQEHGFMFCAVDWNGMATQDVPNAATVLQDLSRFPTLVDHVQQGYLGFLLLGRAMVHEQGLSQQPAFQPEGRNILDTSELYYDGNSQGGIYGGALTAVAPDFQKAVLGVPGMNYSTLLSRSVDFDMYATGNVEGNDLPVGLYDNYPNELERPLIFGLMQMLWDRADPNGYAHHMTSDPLPNTPPHDVLLHVGFGDHQVADVSTEVEARTIGARMHKPGLAPGRERFTDRPYPDAIAPEPFYGIASLGEPGYSATGSGLVFWDIGPVRNDGKDGTPPPPAGNVPPREGNDPHEDPRRSVAGRRQKSAFLSPDSRIVDVCGGPCYAGGWAGPAG